MTAKIGVIGPAQLTASLRIPHNFRINEVPVQTDAACLSPDQPPPLGPLEAFQGTFTGFGFHTIFRPQNCNTPTMANGKALDTASNNILGLNLTKETLSFPNDDPLGAVPNRGAVQGDIKLGGVRYPQNFT